jgi:hypothetical protein
MEAEMATAELQAMTKAKSRGRPKVDRDDVTVKLDRVAASRAKAIANFRGIPVAELLTDIVRAPLDKAYVQMIRELEGGQK